MSKGVARGRPRRNWGAILGTAVSLTTLLGFGFFLYDRFRPAGVPTFTATIASSGKAAELVKFLQKHDGETVALRIDCYSTADSYCYPPPPDISAPFETTFKRSYTPLYLFEGQKCPSLYQACPGGWWLFLSGDDQGLVYNRAGAGTLRITGNWSVQVGALSTIVGPNNISLEAAPKPR